MSYQAFFLGLFLCLVGVASSDFFPRNNSESHAAAMPRQHWDCRIFGRVISRGQPIEGVTVKLDGHVRLSTTTNANGEYSFQNLPPGTYQLVISAGNRFQSENRVVVLRGFGSGPTATGEKKQFDISLERMVRPTPAPSRAPTPFPTASPRASITVTPDENANVSTNVNNSNGNANSNVNGGTSSVDEQISNMLTGKIVYDIPNVMRLGESTVIRVGIAKSITDDVKVTIESNRNVTVQDIKIKDVMAVDLISEEAAAFEVRRQQPAGSSAWQTIGGDAASEWIFDVTPRMSGAHKLRLVASVLLDDPKKQNAPLSLKVYENDITVSTSYLYYAQEFVKSYWQFLLTTLLIPAGAMAWKYFKRSPKPPEPPDWQSAA